MKVDDTVERATMEGIVVQIQDADHVLVKWKGMGGRPVLIAKSKLKIVDAEERTKVRKSRKKKAATNMIEYARILKKKKAGEDLTPEEFGHMHKVDLFKRKTPREANCGCNTRGGFFSP